MSDFSVCILTAGLGSRMGPFSDIINKSLLPYKNKALITHIIEKFGKDRKYVIAVGYKKQQVIDYITIAHSNLNVTFVEIENFDSPNAGPAQSLYSCRDFLKNRFYFVSCDTLFDDFEIDENFDKNWIGISERPYEQSFKYCNIKVNNDKVTEIKDKEYCDNSFQSFIGLMHIKDSDIFFDNMSETISNKTEISQGFKSNLNLYAYNYSWKDFGTYELYKNEISKIESFDFCKTDEFFYDVDNRIIKFHKDETVSYDKYVRTLFNRNVFPKDFCHINNYHYYEKIEGKTLYEKIDDEIFENFLSWMKDEVWFKVTETNFKDKCFQFYYRKTIDRLEQYYKKYPNFSDFNIVNGKKVIPLQTCIKQIDWDYVCDGTSYFIHGDLQFDNVLFNDGKFTLLDWRQKFSNSYFGDVYYDLSKIYGGMILNYNSIKKGKLKYEKRENELMIDLDSLNQAENLLLNFKQFIQKESFDFKKVELIVPIIYANMSPLHNAPFDTILYGLAQYQFTNWFEKYGNN